MEPWTLQTGAGGLPPPSSSPCPATARSSCVRRPPEEGDLAPQARVSGLQLGSICNALISWFCFCVFPRGGPPTARQLQRAEPPPSSPVGAPAGAPRTQGVSCSWCQASQPASGPHVSPSHRAFVLRLRRGLGVCGQAFLFSPPLLSSPPAQVLEGRGLAPLEPPPPAWHQGSAPPPAFPVPTGCLMNG